MAEYVVGAPVKMGSAKMFSDRTDCAMPLNCTGPLLCESPTAYFDAANALLLTSVWSFGDELMWSMTMLPGVAKCTPHSSLKSWRAHDSGKRWSATMATLPPLSTNSCSALVEMAEMAVKAAAVAAAFSSGQTLSSLTRRREVWQGREHLRDTTYTSTSAR
jgi:hypothetical protein